MRTATSIFSCDVWAAMANSMRGADYALTRLRCQRVAGVRSQRSRLDLLGHGGSELGQGLEQPAFQPARWRRLISYARRPHCGAGQRPAHATRRRHHERYSGTKSPAFSRWRICRWMRPAASGQWAARSPVFALSCRTTGAAGNVGSAGYIVRRLALDACSQTGRDWRAQRCADCRRARYGGPCLVRVVCRRAHLGAQRAVHDGSRLHACVTAARCRSRALD